MSVPNLKQNTDLSSHSPLVHSNSADFLKARELVRDQLALGTPPFITCRYSHKRVFKPKVALTCKRPGGSCGYCRGILYHLGVCETIQVPPASIYATDEAKALFGEAEITITFLVVSATAEMLTLRCANDHDIELALPWEQLSPYGN